MIKVHKNSIKQRNKHLLETPVNRDLQNVIVNLFVNDHVLVCFHTLQNSEITFILHCNRDCNLINLSFFVYSLVK